MRFTFNFNSLRGLFSSFTSPRHEVEVPVSRGRLKVQLRGSKISPEYYLRLSAFGQVNYFEFEEDEIETLAKALNEIVEVNQSQPKA